MFHVRSSAISHGISRWLKLFYLGGAQQARAWTGAMDANYILVVEDNDDDSFLIQSCLA